MVKRTVKVHFDELLKGHFNQNKITSWNLPVENLNTREKAKA